MMNIVFYWKQFYISIMVSCAKLAFCVKTSIRKHCSDVRMIIKVWVRTELWKWPAIVDINNCRFRQEPSSETHFLSKISNKLSSLSRNQLYKWHFREKYFVPNLYPDGRYALPSWWMTSYQSFVIGQVTWLKPSLWTRTTRTPAFWDTPPPPPPPPTISLCGGVIT